MLRIIAISCLVLSVLAGPQAPIESDTPLERTGGGIQKFNAGKRQTGDKLIFSGTGNQAIDFAKQIIMEVPFPNEVDKPNNAVITQIVATTALDAGNTQFSILSGGIGQKSVDLKIVSTYAHKVSYKIEIYGK